MHFSTLISRFVHFAHFCALFPHFALCFSNHFLHIQNHRNTRSIPRPNVPNRKTRKAQCFYKKFYCRLIRILQLLEALNRSRQLYLRLHDRCFSAPKPTLRYFQVDERPFDVSLKMTVCLTQNVDKGLTLIEIERTKCAPEILNRHLSIRSTG